MARRTIGEISTEIAALINQIQEEINATYTYANSDVVKEIYKVFPKNWKKTTLNLSIPLTIEFPEPKKRTTAKQRKDKNFEAFMEKIL